MMVEVLEGDERRYRYPVMVLGSRQEGGRGSLSLVSAAEGGSNLSTSTLISMPHIVYSVFTFVEKNVQSLAAQKWSHPCPRDKTHAPFLPRPSLTLPMPNPTSSCTTSTRDTSFLRTQMTEERSPEQLTLDIHRLSLNRNEEGQEGLERNQNHQQPNAAVSFCLFHMSIIQKAIQRNDELIQTYYACFLDLSQDERFHPTRNLYQRLITELKDANCKMNRIHENLSNSVSMQTI